MTPSVVYISYDGASEPLGRSQVVSYLRLLASSAQITLISFEKAHDAGAAEQTARMLEDAGIVWHPLRYHKKPPVISTLWDVASGVRALRAVVRSAPVDVVHVRSYVPVLIAVLSARTRRWALLFDIRGFWVDERVEGGMWRRDGLLYRIGKRCERWFFREADAVVTLTQASVPQIRRWLGEREIQIEVIPTCAPVERFIASSAPRDGAKTVWCGSIGGMYRFDLAVRLADAIGRPFTVLTRQPDAALTALGDREADVREVAPERVPDELAAGDIGLCLYGRDFSNLARAPTRLAEYLAAGMPVAVTPDIGDLDEVVTEHRLGVVVSSDDEGSLAAASAALRELADDPHLPERARAVARERFTLEAGADAYRRLYDRLAALS
jgi:glycosyltransferase involved in cell wall biosynthesis